MKWLFHTLIAFSVLLNKCATKAASIDDGQQIITCAGYVASGANASPPTDDYEDDLYDLDDPPTTTPMTPSPSAQPLPTAVPCSAGQRLCYSVWRTDPPTAIGAAASVTIIRQGCWQSDEQQSACQTRRCVNSRPNSVHRFCCCMGNMCNQNVTSEDALLLDRSQVAGGNVGDGNDDDDGDTIGPYPATQLASLWSMPLVWICLAITAALFAGVGALLAFSNGKQLADSDEIDGHTQQTLEDAKSMGGGVGPGFSATTQSVDNLQLCAMIGRGRYGTVWKGMVNDRVVAVKIFPAQHRQYFVNERNIYALDLMDSPSLLEYYGSDTRRHTTNGQLEHLLVLSLAPHGCLQDWLIENTATFPIFVRMAKSVIRGLAHLHTDLRMPTAVGGSTGDTSMVRTKPCVVHRDLNTRNILVKADLSCCIADFGFALKMYGSRYEWKGEMALAETKSVAEVGTLRYLAPEVLEGAVNLRECETALKQIDVYALGLVLWELCTRCSDWYPTTPNAGQQQPTSSANESTPSNDPVVVVVVPPYMSPYEAEVGKQPSFEMMQSIVSRHKVRPGFAATWGGQSASARLARITCEDCWDHDAEARLTAMCAEERMHELSVLGPTAALSSPRMTLGDDGYVNNQQQQQQQQQPSVYYQSAGIGFEGQMHHQPRSLYQSNVVTAIITPPNQNIPSMTNPLLHPQLPTAAASKVITIQQHSSTSSMSAANKIVGESVGHHHHDNFFHHDVNNSVEELITSSSVSDYSTPNATGTLGIALRGWHGLRSLIEKKLLRKNANKKAQPKIMAKIVRTSATVNQQQVQQHQAMPSTSSAHVAPRPRHLVLLEQQQQQQLQQQRSHPLPSENPPTTFRPQPQQTEQRIQPRIVISKSATNVQQMPAPSAATLSVAVGEPTQFRRNNSLSDDADLAACSNEAERRQIRRQRSLDMFHEVFGAKGSIERLRDPAHRVKTPGDVPAAVRRMRASKTLSLYDDRMMVMATSANDDPLAAITAMMATQSKVLMDEGIEAVVGGGVVMMDMDTCGGGGVGGGML